MMNILTRIGVEIVRWPFLFFFWWIRGWGIEADMPDIPKMIIVAAPHTTNWDYPHFLAVGATYRRRTMVTSKASLLTGVKGIFFRAMGGFAIDRAKSTNAVEAMADYIKERDRVIFVFTPDGTRSYRPYWRTGFYYTAVAAEVPFVLAYIDYNRKRIGFSQPIYPTGNLKTDFAVIKEFYRTRDVAALYPDKANPVELPPYEQRSKPPKEDAVLSESEAPAEMETSPHE